MKIIIKNIKQVQYNVEVPSDTITIKDLKSEIEKSHGFDSSQLKLLYSGAVLDDSKTLQEYNIKEDSVIIMMNSKVKPKNVPTTSTENPKPENLPKTEEKKPEEKNTEEKKTEEKKPEEKKTSPDYSEQMTNLLSMGCEQAKAEQAIKAAKGNLQLAIDFYFNGIPENLNTNLNNEENEQTEENPIKTVASIAKIICQNNPASLAPLLQNIGQNDPDLMNLIKENEEEFKRYLESPVTEEDYRALSKFQQETGIGMGTESSNRPRGGVRIALSNEEKEAIKRLKELGNFSESDVVQAYIACDKNEEMTANYLFEQKMKDDDEMFGGNHGNNNNNNQGGQ